MAAPEFPWRGSGLRRLFNVVLASAAISAVQMVPALAQDDVKDGVVGCLIQPSIIAQLSTPVDGTVSAIHVERGQNVEAGTLLAELDARVEETELKLASARAAQDAELLSARANAEHLARKLERLQRLRQSGVVPQSELDEVTIASQMAAFAAGLAEERTELAGLEVERAEALLRQHQIHAPIDGIITDIAMAVGEYRHEQAYVLTIAKIDPLYVEIAVPIAQFGSFEVGDRALLDTPDAPQLGRLEARVSVIDRVFDSASGNFGARLELANADGSLPAGVGCELIQVLPEG
jgi:RND family efflux transporter MFP subunit